MNLLLQKTNRLIQDESGVWIPEGRISACSEEKDPHLIRIRNILENSKDLTSHSIELERKYADWDFDSEFHLSPRRGNPLRGINLSGVKKALEIGCECGSITRYLGELNIRVDAVEPSMEKGKLARIRCRDIEGVEIICAGITDLIFPEKRYDAVFLIGILDQIKIHAPSVTETREAVISILSRVSQTLKDDGVLLVAAGNRMGLKYWLGASETQYETPYTGLYGYGKTDGPRTYDKKEWENIFAKTNFKEYR
ncbi:MAG: class I SAM-dependent methyltransferase, partial [Thermodesulfobacteriota bacterium]